MFKIRIACGVVVLALLIASIPTHVTAQITIAENDILGLIGQKQVMEEDTSGSVTIDVGSPGANQTWDLSFQIQDPFSLDFSYQSPSGSPFESDFPTANLMRTTTDKSGTQGAEEFTQYFYFEVGSTTLASLGGGFVSKNPDMTFLAMRFDEVAPLPIAFGNNWTRTSTDSFGDPSTFATITHRSADNQVDGWGQVILPMGTFDGLRVRSDVESITQQYIGGNLTSSDTSKTIEYVWVNQDNFVLAIAQSQNNETNPGFTNASDFQRLFSFVVKVEEDRNLVPADFALFQNYPNPFNPSTLISYAIPEQTRARLVIFNLLGQPVRTLVDHVQPAGRHETRWDGRDENGLQLPSGLYFYRLEAGGLLQIRKMALVH